MLQQLSLAVVVASLLSTHRFGHINLLELLLASRVNFLALLCEGRSWKRSLATACWRHLVWQLVLSGAVVAFRVRGQSRTNFG